MSIMESCEPAIELGSTLYAKIVTHSSTLVAAAPSAAPSYQVYSADGTTPIGAPGTATQFAATTGLYKAEIVCSSGNGFAAGSHYKVVFTYVIGGTTYTKVVSFAVA